jgi:hypothetical protein
MGIVSFAADRRFRGKRTRNAAERPPSEVADASKEILSQERRQICIKRAMPADLTITLRKS